MNLPTHIFSTPEAMGPAHLLGIEQEFDLLENNLKIDSRDYLQKILSHYQGRRFPAGPHGSFVDKGFLYICDGVEAEIATAPVETKPGAVCELANSVACGTQHFLQALNQFNEVEQRSLSLRGYSTHLNAYSTLVDTDQVCKLYARTMAPAMMLFMDLTSSPGLLVRPRENRFELGGEFISHDNYLQAAIGFFLTSYLAIVDSISRGSQNELPFSFDDSNILPATQRYGYYVDRSAFGNDLYKRGRDAKLLLKSKEIVTAQQVLEDTWAHIKHYGKGRLNSADIQEIELRIQGIKTLPCEINNISDYLEIKTNNEQQFLAKHCTSSFAKVLSTNDYEELIPEFASWDFVLFRFEALHGTRYLNVPRRYWKSFIEERKTNNFTTELNIVAASDEHINDLDDITKAQSPGIHERYNKEALSEPYNNAGKKKKKKKGQPPGCKVDVISEEFELNPPIIRICLYATTEAFELSPDHKQEPPINAVNTGIGVNLQSGAFSYIQQDLTTRAVGMDFEFSRFYKSSIKFDGIIGQNWDFFYNKRLIPSTGIDYLLVDGGFCEIYHGPTGPAGGDITYYSGTGRKTIHAFDSWQHRTVERCGPNGLDRFKAVVTTYKQNPGEEFEFQRYAIYDGPLPWNTPIFYICRHKDGSEYIFNCSGYIIAMRDANLNTMWFHYGMPFNPTTGYMVLRRIEDTSGRQYSLDYDEFGGKIRLKSLIDEDGRTVQYQYNGQGELIHVDLPKARHSLIRKHYKYSSRPGLLTNIFEPNGGGTASIQNIYNGAERVIQQKEGPHSSTFQYSGETVSVCIDPRGIETQYLMVQKHDTFVLEDLTIINSQPVQVPGISLASPADYVTHYEYNNDFLITLAEFPDGSSTKFEYENFNRPVVSGDERNWVERQVTFINDLSKGNILKQTDYPSSGNLAPIETTFEYEHRYNEVTRMNGSLGERLFEYLPPSSSHPSSNASPIKITNPPLRQPDGTHLDYVLEFTYGDGGLITLYRDGDGVVTTYLYHKSGAIEEMTVDPSGHSMTHIMIYDKRGNLESSTDPEGNKKKFKFDERDNLIWKEDQTGNTSDLDYDRNDNLIEIREQVTDDSASFSLSSASYNGTLTTTITYDSLDQVESVNLDSSGVSHTTRNYYDADGNLIRVEEPGSENNQILVTEYHYDSRGLMYHESAGVGTNDKLDKYYGFDDAGYTTEHLTNGAGQWSYTYNGHGQLTETLSPIGTQTKIKRNPAGQPIRTQVFGKLSGPSPTNRSTTNNTLLKDVIMSFDSMGRVVQESVSRFDTSSGLSGGVSKSRSSYFRRTDGQESIIVDAEGRRTKNKFDSAGRIKETKFPGGHLSQYIYNNNSQLIQKTDIEKPEGNFFFQRPNALVTTQKYEYDEKNRIKLETSSSTGSTMFAYDSRGVMRGMKSPNGARQETKYDALAQQSGQIIYIDPNSFISNGEISTSVTYKPNGLEDTITDGVGNVVSYTYDVLGRIKSIKDPDGNESTTTYNNAGLPDIVEGRGGERIQVEYDALGRTTKRTHLNPAANTIELSMEYDGVDNLTKVTDNDGQNITIVERQYDSMGLLLSETESGDKVTLDYDLTGNSNYIQYPSGTQLYFDHTTSGKLDSISRNGVIVSQFSYVGSKEAEHVRPTTLIDPQSGSRSIFPLISLHHYNTQGYLETFSHLIHDDVTNPSSPNNIYLLRPLRMSYDQMGRLESKSSSDYKIQYKYDKANRLTETIADPVYDQFGVSREVTEIEYDAAHNKRYSKHTVESPLGQSIVTEIQATPNVLNAPEQEVRTTGTNPAETRNFSYHSSGSLFKSKYERRSRRFGTVRLSGNRELFFDAFGRLVMVFIANANTSGTNWRVWYRYDGFGRRILRIQEQVTGPSHTVLDTLMTKYRFWGDRCIEEWERTSTSQPWQPARRYIHGNGTNKVLAVDVREDYVLEDINGDGQIQGGTSLFLLHDHEHSSMALIRSEHYGSRFPFVYERYMTGSAGNTDLFSVDDQGRHQVIESSSSGHIIMQHGRWHHQLEGLYYNGRRFYDPDSGVFVSRDPGGPWADLASMGNGYSYAGNDPTNNFDPSGGIAESVWDAASLGIGVASVALWDENTSSANKALDIFGIVIDTAALILPFVPGGVGAGLKAYRAATSVSAARKVYKSFDSMADGYKAMRLGKQVQRGINAARAAEMTGHAANSYHTFLQTGSPLAGVLALVSGFSAIRSGRLAQLGVCFTGETLVATNEGNRRIDSINVGDEVLSFDEVVGTTLSRPVTRCFESTTDGIYEITLTSDESSDIVRVTPDHPFLSITTGEWSKAKALIKGDKLQSILGDVVVSKILWLPDSKGIKSYNLEVAGSHTYLVSASQVTVHNSCAFEEVTHNIGRAVDKLKRVQHAVTSKSGKGIDWREMIGVDYTIKRITEHFSYRLIGAVKTRGNQGIDLIFEGVGPNAGKFALAEAKASRGLSALKKDKLGIRQGSLDFFITRLERAGPEYDHIRTLLANGTGMVELFGGFAGGLVRRTAKLKAGTGGFVNGRLYRFNPAHFNTTANFRKTPAAATCIFKG